MAGTTFFRVLRTAVSTRRCLAIAASVLASGLPAQTLLSSSFRANVQLVLVPVTVTDSDGKTIQGLRARDFTVLDDQVSQPIASFSSEDAPCSVGLVLDISGSMRYALGTTKQVAQIFVREANPQDEFQLLTVSSRPHEVSGFTADTNALAERIESAKPDGRTALFDTVYLGLTQMRGGTRPRRALLILSDGMENQSRYSKGDLMRLALEANVQVYTIVVDGLAGGSPTIPARPSSMILKPGQQASERQGPQTLEQLSKRTGGLYFHVRNASEGKEVAIQAASALRNEYVIGYQSPHLDSAGKWHRVRVKSSVPKVHIYARGGYYSR
jgi:Ca-activated chloride channel family protein